MTKEEKLARKQQRKAEKVGLGKLLLWNSSSCSVALSTLMLGYATFYCTDVLQLAPALVGTLFMVSKIFDSFTDIVAGFIVDRTQTRWGKGRPYEIFMLFLWLSTWLLFSCPTSFATAAKCIWIFCMYTFMNSICVTFLNANNVVYMVRAFENKEQQSKIVGYGSIFTMAGAMVFNVLFPTAMAKVGTDAVGWSRLVGMIAIPLTAIGMLRILTIPEKFTPVSEKNGEQTHLKDLLPLLKESRPVLIICMVRFVQNIATGLGVGTYYWQYIIGNLGMMGVASVTTILVLPLAFALPVLRKKFGMAGMSVIGILVGCIGYLATFFAGGNMVFFIVAALLVSAGAVPLNMMFNMFIADVADYNEWKSAGKAQVKDYFAKIPCIYEPGELVGVGYDADVHEIYRTSVRTADAETVLTVKTDKNILRAGGQDFCFADVYVTDKNGTVKLLPDYDVKIEVDGAASLQGYGSAAYKNAEHYDQHHHKSWQGHLQAVLRSTEKTGPVTVTFTADGCAPAILHLSAE